MNIYVANIPWKATEDQLRDLFNQYGEVNTAKIILDRETQRSRGFGFVEMSDEAAARKVALLRREHRFLAAVAGCVDVGDIVAGRPQRGIGGVQGRSADVENAGGHGCELCGLQLNYGTD